MLNNRLGISKSFYLAHFVAYILKIGTMRAKTVMSLDVTGIFKNCGY